MSGGRGVGDVFPATQRLVLGTGHAKRGSSPSPGFGCRSDSGFLATVACCLVTAQMGRVEVRGVFSEVLVRRQRERIVIDRE